MKFSKKVEYLGIG